jgi:hypothetical protein
MLPKVIGGASHALPSPLPLAPNLIGRLVFAQPDINRVSQEVVGRPSQIGDLGDNLFGLPIGAHGLAWDLLR